MQLPMGPPGMGHPNMGPPGMGGPQPPRPQARKGTSKAVPIVVSAGLAIGTFCGLLFGLGTGTEDAVAEPAKGDTKKDGKDPSMSMEGSKVTDPGTPKIDKPATATASAGSAAPAAGSGAAPAQASAAPATGSAAPAGGTTTAAAGSGAAPATGSAAPAGGTTATAAPTVKTAKLTIEVTPEAAAKDVKITIDRKEITGLAKDVELTDGKKTVTLTVKSSGYHSVNDQKVDVDGDMTVKIEMKKKAAVPGGLPRPGGKKDGKSSKTGGGLIDI
ncbi:MAG: hypothetical protein ACKV2T_43450 [Kofleriaceae bacterium]